MRLDDGGNKKGDGGPIKERERRTMKAGSSRAHWFFVSERESVSDSAVAMLYGVELIERGNEGDRRCMMGCTMGMTSMS